MLSNFFGSIFINRDRLREAGINYPIKVEYYKVINELTYGIQVIKTEYREKIGVEQKRIENVTNNELEINNILSLIKQQEVTPIGLEDVIVEIKKIQALAKSKKISYNKKVFGWKHKSSRINGAYKRST